MRHLDDGSIALPADQWRKTLVELELQARLCELLAGRLAVGRQDGAGDAGGAAAGTIAVGFGDLCKPRDYTALVPVCVPDDVGVDWPLPSPDLPVLRPPSGRTAASLAASHCPAIGYDLYGLDARATEQVVRSIEAAQRNNMNFVPVFITDGREVSVFLRFGYVFEVIPPEGSAPFDPISWAAYKRDRYDHIRRKWGLISIIDLSGRSAAKASRAGAASVVVAFPDYREGNPYQSLMYRDIGKSFALLFGDIEQANLQVANGAATIFHLHWEDAVYRFYPPDGQDAAVTRFLDGVRRFKGAGGRLVWTVHNIVAHDGGGGRVGERLKRELVGLADRLHVHSDWARDELIGTYAAEARRVAVVEHPSYADVYPPGAARDATRAQFGPRPDDTVLLFFGNIRRYKGIEGLLEAVERAGRDVKLIVAGRAGPYNPVVAGSDRIIRIDRYVDDQELADLLTAADFAVLPFQRITTSGSLMLALTFGVPVIVPRLASLQHLIRDGREGLLFDPDDPDDLGHAVERARQLSAWQRQAMATLARASVALRHPHVFAGEMHALLADLAGGSPMPEAAGAPAAADAAALALGSRNP
ncbi:MAG: glycosyltransferase family 4 protein [Rhodospirillaceae bacterium]|nr:glycosyltransferase family 4 protein [Rhodospirillaceae bacterium]